MTIPDVAVSARTLNDPDERWLTVPGFPDYEASSWGRFRRAADHSPVALTPNGSGYPYVFLRDGNRRRNKRANRLLYAAFHGPVPSGKRVTFADGDHLNLRPSNLEALTAKEISARQLAAGTNHPVWTAPKIRLGRRASAIQQFRQGASIGEAARRSGISRTAAARIKKSLGL